MKQELFYKLPRKKKVGYVISKLAVVLGIIGAGVGAIFASGNNVLTVSEKMSVSMGAILIVIVAAIAGLGRLRSLVKVKSIGILITFAILWAFQSVINSLIWAVGLISIPMLVDDIIVNPLWMNYVVNNLED